MVDSVDDSEIIALNTKTYSFPEFGDVRCEHCVRSEQDHPEFLLQEKGQSGAQKQYRSLRGTQIAHVMYDYFWVTGAHGTVLDHADLVSIHLRSVDDVQEFDTRWDENTIVNEQDPTG